MVGLDFPGSHSTVEPTVSIAVGGRTGIVTRVIRRANRVAAGGSTPGPLLVHYSILPTCHRLSWPTLYFPPQCLFGGIWPTTHPLATTVPSNLLIFFYQFTLWASTSVCHVEFGSSEGVPGQVANEGGCHERGEGVSGWRYPQDIYQHLLQYKYKDIKIQIHNILRISGSIC